MKQPKRAFTLVELLVVISVIAVLMAILMPALGRARDQAKSVVCQSQLRSLHKAMEFYTQDHEGKTFGYGLNHNAGTFYCVLNPYIGRIDELSLCPVAEVRRDLSTSNDIDGTARQPWVWAAKALSCPAGKCKVAGCQEFGSYTFNGYLYNASAERILGGVEEILPERASDTSRWYKSWTQVKETSRTPFLGDGIWVYGWPQDDDTPPFAKEYLETPHESYNKGMLRFCIDRHHNAVNLAYVDGHVERVGLTELWQQKWHRSFSSSSDVSMP